MADLPPASVGSGGPRRGFLWARWRASGAPGRLVWPGAPGRCLPRIAPGPGRFAAWFGARSAWPGAAAVLLRGLEPSTTYEVRITAAYEEDARLVKEPSPVGPPAPLAPPTGGASGGGRIEAGERGARSPEGGCAGPRG